MDNNRKPTTRKRQSNKKMTAEVVTELDMITIDIKQTKPPGSGRRLTAEDRIRLRKKRRKRVMKARIVLAVTVFLLVLLLFFVGKLIFGNGNEGTFHFVDALFHTNKMSKVVEDKPDMTEELLTVNAYSRPGEKLEKVKSIFIHYTANLGTTAAQNRSYFENLGETGETSASAHFIIGYEGEIIQCVPLEEIAYAVRHRNFDSISIECCYTEESGHFTQATYTSLLHLTSWLMGEYNLSPDDVYRHYDEGGKLCPKYYVEHPDAWKSFKMDLENYIEACGTKAS